MSDHVYKKIELVGSSPDGFDAAVKNALERASQTIRNMRWFEVTETRGQIENGQVNHWQVTLKVGFTLEGHYAHADRRTPNIERRMTEVRNAVLGLVFCRRKIQLRRKDQIDTIIFIPPSFGVRRWTFDVRRLLPSYRCSWDA